MKSQLNASQVESAINHIRNTKDICALLDLAIATGGKVSYLGEATYEGTAAIQFYSTVFGAYTLRGFALTGRKVA